ncbi:MAG: hypothetical protein ACOYM1_12205 [Methylovulum sp.]
MLTKADFQQVIKDTIASYPKIAPLYQAEDPRILQHLDAMATMLGLFSGQIETALAEPFLKMRDSTILADAALRGIISKATPTRAKIKVVNANARPYSLSYQRVLHDSNGYEWRVETPITVPANSTGYVECEQLTVKMIEHTVVNSVPFYAILLPEDSSGQAIASIALNDSAGNAYEYRERYVNTLPDERVFHVESDDRKQLYVRLGYRNVVGVQPKEGEVYTLTLGYTDGDIDLDAEQGLAFEYLLSPYDNFVTLTADSVLISGSDQPDISTLRDLCKFPSVYNHTAVYLGEFDFLIRRSFNDLKFLSIWNESMEEAVRGASVDNINTLFVAVVSLTGEELSVLEGEQPYLIPEYLLTGVQQAIRQKIHEADNSYRVRFYTPVKTNLLVEIDAEIPTSYPANVVREQIITALLAEFGIEAFNSKRGRNLPLYKQIYNLLRLKIPALSVDNKSDFKVTIPQKTALYHPENWTIMTPESLIISVNSFNVVNAHWGG